MAQDREVTIEHRDGRVFKVMESAFDSMEVEDDKTYKGLGFKITALADGSPYLTETQAEREAQRQARAEERVATRPVEAEAK